MLTFLVLALLVVFVVVTVVARIARNTQLASREKPPPYAPIGPIWLGRMMPQDPMQAFTAAICVSALVGIGLVLVGIYFVRQYGWAVFVLTPFVMGFVSASLASYHRELTMARCALVGSLTVVTAGLGFFALGVEGIICLLMAVPIAVPSAVVGALVAFLFSKRDVGPLRPRWE